MRVDGGGEAWAGGGGAKGEGEGVGVGERGGARAHEAVERAGEVLAGAAEVGAEEAVPWDGAGGRRGVAASLVGRRNSGEEEEAVAVTRRGHGAKETAGR